MKKDSFVFYRSFFEALQDMGKEEQADCLMTLCDYALNGEEATRKPPTPMAGMFLKLVKPQIDANNRRYENGQKGGRPKTKPEPNQNQTQTKQTPNDNDNENDNDFNKKKNDKKKKGSNAVQSDSYEGGTPL